MSALLSSPAMINLFLVFAHLLATIAKLLRPGGARALVSENLLLKKQLLIVGRSRKRAPKLKPVDRLYLRILVTLLGPRRTVRSAVIIRPSTFHRFHEAHKIENIGFSTLQREGEGLDPKDHLPNLFSSF